MKNPKCFFAPSMFKLEQIACFVQALKEKQNFEFISKESFETVAIFESDFNNAFENFLSVENSKIQGTNKHTDPNYLSVESIKNFGSFSIQEYVEAYYCGIIDSCLDSEMLFCTDLNPKKAIIKRYKNNLIIELEF